MFTRGEYENATGTDSATQDGRRASEETDREVSGWSFFLLLFKLDALCSDRKALKIEMERLMMNKQCTRCQQTYTEKTNSAGTCCYHPGRLVERNYPFHGFAWTCCQKPDKNALPCTLGGRHTDTSCHSDTKQPEQQLDSEDLAPWHFDAS